MAGKVSRVSGGKEVSSERVIPGLMEEVRIQHEIDKLNHEITRGEKAIEQTKLEARNLNRPPPVAILAEKENKVKDLEAKMEEKIEELQELGRKLRDNA